MSGFEVAGIVLGVFPLAINALEKYREVAIRIGLFYKIRLEYKKCRDELEFHRLTFTNHLKHLLLPLVADDDKIRQMLAEPGGESWREEGIAKLLQKRLQHSHGLYLGYIKEIERIVADINQELVFSSDPVQERVHSPTAPMSATRVKNALSKDGRTFQLYKLKFSNSETVRKRLFIELEDCNSKLEKLLRSSDTNTQLVQQRVSVAQGGALDTAICNFWVQADKVFRALASAWNCRCEAGHSANLLLQQRLTKKAEFHLTFATFKTSQWDIHKTRISGEFSAAAVTIQDTARIIETVPIHQPQSHRQNVPLKSAMKSTGSTTYVKLQMPTPAITLTSMHAGKNLAHGDLGTPISTLCTSLEQLEEPCCGYLDKDDCRYYVYSVSRQRTESLTSITLDQILRGTAAPQLTRTQRYTLSLILASSFIQLLDSPWLPAAFRKDEIVFLCDPDDPTIILLDQPHMKRTSFDKGDERKADLYSSIDALGIMLLELCFGRMLEDHPHRKGWPIGSNDKEKAVFDVAAARNWQCDINEEAGLDYADAVGWCFGTSRSTPRKKWRQEMLRGVIQPLQQCRDYLSGGDAVYM